MKVHSSKFCLVLCHCISVFSVQGVLAVHLVKLSADLQRCPVLGLWNVEPYKQAAAHAEEEEYEEAEALQMLLLGDIIFSKKRGEEDREHIASVCYFSLVLCHCLTLHSSGSPL